mgnify:CR=1 FL=1
MHRAAAVLLLVLALLLAACGGAGTRDAKVGGAPVTAPDPPAGATSVLTGSMNAIDGTPVDLASYRGKVVLVVNTASRCGYTSQYEGLEKVYREYADQGLVVLGFPSNDFQQELGSDAEVKTFCSTKFDVTFPLMSRSAVLGPDANPVFRALASQPDGIGAPPQWNFTKYLLDRDGMPVARWKSNVEPQTPSITNVIEALLATPA